MKIQRRKKRQNESPAAPVQAQFQSRPFQDANFAPPDKQAAPPEREFQGEASGFDLGSIPLFSNGNSTPTQPIQRSEEEDVQMQAESKSPLHGRFQALAQRDSPKNSTPQQPIQAKLTVGAVGDKYEQEADRVADVVVDRIQSPPATTEVQKQEEETLQQKPQLSTPPTISQLQKKEELSNTLQRESEEEEFDDDNDDVQMKPQTAEAGGEVSADFESSLRREKGGGQPLNENLQSQMGRAMGADFGGVRIHQNSPANQLNQSIQAKAFTTGKDIFFKQGEYQPESRGGQKLIAHELTHVVQQGGVNNSGSVQRFNSSKEERKHLQILLSEQKAKGRDKMTQEFKDFSANLKLPATSKNMDRWGGERPRSNAINDNNTGNKPVDKLDNWVNSDTADVTGNTASVIEGLTSITGEIATKGLGNSGDTETGIFQKYFEKAGANMSDADQNVLSGRSDMAGAVAGGVGNILGGFQALNDLRQAEDNYDRSKAVLQGGSSLAGLASNVAKFGGGYLTQKDGGAANLDPSWISKDLNTSDSWKFVGDGIGAVSGGLGFGAQAVGGVKDFKSWLNERKKGIYGDTKSGGKGSGAYLRSLGRGVKSAANLGQAGVTTTLGVGKLIAQFGAEGGKIGADALKLGSQGAIAPLANLAAASGGLGIATGAMDLASGGFKAFKATERKGLIKGLQQGNKQFSSVSESERNAALEHLKEIQTKKQKRGGLGMAEGALAVTAGALALTGAGAVVGAGLAAIGGIAKLGRFAFNKIKQNRRDKADRKDKQWQADMETAGLSEEQINNVFLARQEREDQQYEQAKSKGGFSKFKAWFKKKMKADKTKSTDAKDQRYETTAKTLIKMNDAEPGIMLKLVNLPEKQMEGMSGEEKLELVKKALKKR
ncbi:MAG: DUF4157 domain-containing protein [Limnospira sp. PMC 1256.20]|uniref:DUF4157 domain-containing protein n=1 Tax=Limnospira sp. PMC 1256.20 TaxID=2981054 RepID=UPI0028E0E590|nr:DUF4157 domain-containing protein [Limnospira sp. PMC 1256.20]MDT9214316.1 DUF4157 domain-containing protein [Limnospira sp. PMC 1256.20]